MHAPHPAHSAEFTSAIPVTSFIVRAEYAHTSMQTPHPAQSSGSTHAINGSFSRLSLEMIPSARDAAPLACAAASAMSLGAWQAPERKIPPTKVSLGLSLGCASRRKPSALLERCRVLE